MFCGIRTRKKCYVFLAETSLFTDNEYFITVYACRQQQSMVSCVLHVLYVCVLAFVLNIHLTCLPSIFRS